MWFSRFVFFVSLEKYWMSLVDSVGWTIILTLKQSEKKTKTLEIHSQIQDFKVTTDYRWCVLRSDFFGNVHFPKIHFFHPWFPNPKKTKIPQECTHNRAIRRCRCLDRIWCPLGVTEFPAQKRQRFRTGTVSATVFTGGFWRKTRSLS